MTISAEVITDSICPYGNRLTTLRCKYPRFIHQEVLTHRVFSRNSASSRAVPVEKMLDRALFDTAEPIHWGLNQKGMQAESEVPEEIAESAREAWIIARNRAYDQAEILNQLGIHKQVANRLLEPFLHMEIVLSSTEWDNFFELRKHKDAQPEIQALAIAIHDAMEKSEPVCMGFGNWHLPFVENSALSWDILKKMSAARCARVSYYLHEDGTKSTPEKDIALCDRLAGSRPIHASPFEHVATPSSNPDDWANFKGWKQYRREIEESLAP